MHAPLIEPFSSPERHRPPGVVWYDAVAAAAPGAVSMTGARSLCFRDDGSPLLAAARGTIPATRRRKTFSSPSPKSNPPKNTAPVTRTRKTTRARFLFFPSVFFFARRSSIKYNSHRSYTSTSTYTREFVTSSVTARAMKATALDALYDRLLSRPSAFRGALCARARDGMAPGEHLRASRPRRRRRGVDVQGPP